MDTASAILNPTHDAALAELQVAYLRALQRYESSKKACMEMYGSLSILVVPQPDYRVLADASFQVERTRNAVGNLKARRRYKDLQATWRARSLARHTQRTASE
jgi:hypothetical protein